MNPQEPMNPINNPPQPLVVPVEPTAPQTPTLTPEPSVNQETVNQTPTAFDPPQAIAATPPLSPGSLPPAMQSDPSQVSHPQSKLPFIVGIALVSIALVIIIALLAL